MSRGTLAQRGHVHRQKVLLLGGGPHRTRLCDPGEHPRLRGYGRRDGEDISRDQGPLADRLLAAIQAGAEAGDDISVYDAKDPIAEILRLYELQKIHFERSDPADVIPIAGENAAYLQRLLAREAFHKGRTDGIWNQASTEALADYMGWENDDTRIRHDGKIDRKILDLVRQKEGS